MADPIPLTCAELSGSAEEEEDAADGGRGNLDRKAARIERCGAERLTEWITGPPPLDCFHLCSFTFQMLLYLFREHISLSA